MIFNKKINNKNRLFFLLLLFFWGCTCSDTLTPVIETKKVFNEIDENEPMRYQNSSFGYNRIMLFKKYLYDYKVGTIDKKKAYPRYAEDPNLHLLKYAENKILFLLDLLGSAYFELWQNNYQALNRKPIKFSFLINNIFNDKSQLFYGRDALEAQQYFNEIIVNDSNSNSKYFPGALYSSAMLYFTNDKPDSAISSLYRFIQLFPDNIQAHSVRYAIALYSFYNEDYLSMDTQLKMIRPQDLIETEKYLAAMMLYTKGEKESAESFYPEIERFVGTDNKFVITSKLLQNELFERVVKNESRYTRTESYIIADLFFRAGKIAIAELYYPEIAKHLNSDGNPVSFDEMEIVWAENNLKNSGSYALNVKEKYLLAEYYYKQGKISDAKRILPDVCQNIDDNEIIFSFENDVNKKLDQAVTKEFDNEYLYEKICKLRSLLFNN